ncbi:hypothetical protein DSL64_13620 [Dyadobacter luteus]|uniref:Uncharacterized protein n=2 Tax=Dyadobacter luteus TaxID=2259619 RepID=A0A3D8YAZ5_9BACT|nr:hypothetical protein DSL64_13620 [Dyadobacter luteus]
MHMKKLLSEILLSIEERFNYKKIETTREHKQTLYLDTEYIDTSSTKRYIIVTPNQIHSFFEICLYHFHEQHQAEKYFQQKTQDPKVAVKEELTPIISLWFYFKQDENQKHETVVFDTLISPNQRMDLDVGELSVFIEESFASHEEKQMQLSALRGK